MSALRPELALYFALRRLAIDAEETQARAAGTQSIDGEDEEAHERCWFAAQEEVEWIRSDSTMRRPQNAARVRDAVAALESARKLASTWGSTEAEDRALELIRAFAATQAFDLDRDDS